MTYFITRGRTVLCEHKRTRAEAFVRFDLKGYALQICEAWEAETFASEREGVDYLGEYADMEDYEDYYGGASVQSLDDLVERYGYHCPHTQDLFAGAQP